MTETRLEATVARGRWVPGLGGFYADDMEAVRSGAERDGLVYRGGPVTPGHRAVRNAGRSLVIALLDDDGVAGFGDAASVQYAGVVGRDPVLDPERHGPQVGRAVAELAAAGRLGLREGCELIDAVRVDGQPLCTFVRYGVSQALLALLANRAGVTMAEVLRRAYGLDVPEPVPLYAQCGDERHRNVDRMILKRVDEMPHGLINSLELFGPDGEAFLQYAAWVRQRVEELGDPDYAPTLHFDLYGIPGRGFRGDIDRMVALFDRVAVACAPLRVRIEAPIDGGDVVATAKSLAALKQALRRGGVPVDLVADDWCNTIDDIGLFLDLDAADMIQVKLPDLGSVAQAVEAALLVRDRGALVYIGGSCNETDLNARMSVHLAATLRADVMLAKPGMGVDEAVMVCRNEMARLMLLDGVASAR